jgi:hypothetical protein
VPDAPDAKVWLLVTPGPGRAVPFPYRSDHKLPKVRTALANHQATALACLLVSQQPTTPP